jgi:hypothetical protein
MSRCSRKNRPRDPTIDTIETLDIPFEFRTTLGENGADFVLQRASVQNPGHTNRLEGYIVLGDVQILEHLFMRMKGGEIMRMRGGEIMQARRRKYKRNEERIEQFKANYMQDNNIMTFLTHIMHVRLCINN